MKKNKNKANQKLLAKKPIREVDSYTVYDAELDISFKDKESLEQAKKQIREQTSGQNSMGIYFSGGRFFDTYKEMMEYKAAKISSAK